MNRIAAISLAASLLLGSATAWADQFEIKGIMVDKPVDCAHVDALERRTGSFAGCQRASAMFTVDVQFLGRTTVLYLGRSPEGIAETVTVSDFDFDEALRALSAKYGAPTVDSSTVRNGFGASFEQVKATWEADGQTMMLKKHGSKLNKAALYLYGATFKARIDAERAKRSGDI